MSLQEEMPFSKTVYSWVMPETEKVIDEVLADADQRDFLRDLHRKAWTSKQDDFHDLFYREWEEWTSDVLTKHECPYFYPSAGSSEAIRESLAQHAATGHSLPMAKPRIHVFRGEYEGYQALAKAYDIGIIRHDRSGNWRKTVVQSSKGGDLFYLSQPSSLDGNYWHDYDEFLDVLGGTNTKLMLDLCYVGCIPEEAYPDSKIDIHHEVIDSIFFSLSKVFGLYYWRVGGMLSKREHPGLWGNRWFKNLTSLHIGTEFMRRYGVTELPDKYQSLKEEVLEENREFLERAKMRNIESSDVYLLANAGYEEEPESDLPKYKPFQRYDQRARICLTNGMYEKAQEKGLYEYDEDMNK